MFTAEIEVRHLDAQNADDAAQMLIAYINSGGTIEVTVKNETTGETTSIYLNIH